MPGSVIVGGARTPIGKLSGALKGFLDVGGIASTSLLLRIADRRYLRAALLWLRIANDLTGEQEVATLALAAACTHNGGNPSIAANAIARTEATARRYHVEVPSMIELLKLDHQIRSHKGGVAT